MAKCNSEDDFLFEDLDLDNLSDFDDFDEDEIQEFERECLDDKENVDDDGAKAGKRKSVASGCKHGNAKEKKRKDTVAKKDVKYQRPLSDMDDNEILNRCKLPELLLVIRANKVYTDSKYGEELCSLLDSLKGLSECPVMVEYVRDLGVNVLDAIAAGDSKKLGPMADETMSREIYRLQNGNAALKEAWRLMLRSKCNVNNDFLSNFLYTELVKELSKIILPLKHKVSVSNDKINWSLTDDEQQVVRYVAGYVPYSLIKRFRKHNNSVSKAYVKILQSFKSTDDTEGSFEHFSEKWISLQDRGGLFKVNEKAFKLFRCMEHVSKKCLTKSSTEIFQDVGMKEFLSSKVLNDKHTQNCWCALINGTLSEETSEKLFEIIVGSYVKIRCKGFIKSLINIRKQKKDPTVSKKFEKGLRKTLN